MDFLILIKNGCENLTATVSPSIDSLGLHLVLSLAAIMLSWYGVQEALAAAHGGPGFHMGKFLNFFMLLTFAYCFVAFYDGRIPGLGTSLKGYISGGTIAWWTTLAAIPPGGSGPCTHCRRSKWTIFPSFTEPYQTALHLHRTDHAQCSLRIDRGHHRVWRDRRHDHWLLGPVFIPWMVFEKTDFLFWGWLKAFLGFEFYKVVAAATMYVMSHLLVTYMTSGAMNVMTWEACHAYAQFVRTVLRHWLHSAQDSRHDRLSFLRPHRRSRRRGVTIYQRHCVHEIGVPHVPH